MSSEEREYLKAALWARLTEVTPCLNEEQVVAFYSGRLGESELESARDHLAECPRCLEMARDARHFLKAMNEPVLVTTAKEYPEFDIRHFSNKCAGTFRSPASLTR
jgi:hypothetical protein